MPPPPTDRLYFADPNLSAFRARVVGTDALKVALDRSAFYPEGGGQPADTGILTGVPPLPDGSGGQGVRNNPPDGRGGQGVRNNPPYGGGGQGVRNPSGGGGTQVRVLDVQSDGDVVWHSLETPLGVDDVDGTIDWPRRLDHMQQHHGQHLLSAAFERLFKFRTVSFHLGPQSATIDLGTPSVAESQAAGAEDLTNQVIWEDRPVHARFVTPEELATLPLRKPPVVEGAIRVVSVPDFDHSACGGTHPRSTGVVGLLHIRRVEKRGDGTRVEFVCGGRAARDLRAKNALLARVSTSLTVGPDELEAAVGRLRDAEQATRKRLADAMERMASYEATELVAKGAIIRGVYADRSLEDLKVLANQIVKRGSVALLGLKGEKAQLVFAAPPGSPVNCGALLKEVVAEVGGKGGGQPGMAQGGVPDPAKLESALDLAMGRLRAR